MRNVAVCLVSVSSAKVTFFLFGFRPFSLLALGRLVSRELQENWTGEVSLFVLVVDRLHGEFVGDNANVRNTAGAQNLLSTFPFPAVMLSSSSMELSRLAEGESPRSK